MRLIRKGYLLMSLTRSRAGVVTCHDITNRLSMNIHKWFSAANLTEQGLIEAYSMRIMVNIF